MLTPILATVNPYEAATTFTRCGWSLVFETPRDGGDPLTCVELHGAQVMLGVSTPAFLPDEARPYQGAGVEFHVSVPAQAIEGIHEAHRQAGVAGELTQRPWGERAFHAVICGYRFLVAAESGAA